MNERLKETLKGIGATLFVVSPLAFTMAYTSINSNTRLVETSRGRTAVTEWINGKGREVVTGGLLSWTTYTDSNMDGIIDSKTHYFGNPRRGFFAASPKITEDDRAFYSEAVLNAMQRNAGTEIFNAKTLETK